MISAQDALKLRKGRRLVFTNGALSPIPILVKSSRLGVIRIRRRAHTVEHRLQTSGGIRIGSSGVLISRW